MSNSPYQPSCYINSLPGLVPTDNSAQVTSILKEDGTIVQSVTNNAPASSFDGAGFNGTSIKSTKMYTEPDGSINIHLDGPESVDTGIDTEALLDPWNSNTYKLFISKENAREKFIVYEHSGPIQSFALDINTKVNNPIIFSELTTDQSTASLYLRISTNQLLLARGTYVVRLYKSNINNNGYTLFKVFTLTAKSDPIQGPIINSRYLDTMNRLGLFGSNLCYKGKYGDLTSSQISSLAPSLINDLLLQSDSDPDIYYRLGVELDGKTNTPMLFLLQVDKPENISNVVKLNDYLLEDPKTGRMYTIDVEHDTNDSSSAPTLVLTTVTK